MKILSFSLFLAIICLSSYKKINSVYNCKDSVVSFESKAKLEKIRASSTELKGSVDISKRTFNFSIPICSFQGFLNKTQKKHYCEKYVEGEKFPSATFTGKIIEDIDFTVPGTYTARAKGIFSLHGVEREVIITGNIVSKGKEFTINSKFTIPLADHDMKLSKGSALVIARVVDVQLQSTLSTD